MSMLLRYIFQIIGSLVFMFTLSPKLTGVLISVVPIVGIGAQQYGLYSDFSFSLHMYLFHRLLNLEIKQESSSPLITPVVHKTVTFSNERCLFCTTTLAKYQLF